jgi:hypothetical protein
MGTTHTYFAIATRAGAGGKASQPDTLFATAVATRAGARKGQQAHQYNTPGFFGEGGTYSAGKNASSVQDVKDMTAGQAAPGLLCTGLWPMCLLCCITRARWCNLSLGPYAAGEGQPDTLLPALLLPPKLPPVKAGQPNALLPTSVPTKLAPGKSNKGILSMTCLVLLSFLQRDT